MVYLARSLSLSLDIATADPDINIIVSSGGMVSLRLLTQHYQQSSSVLFLSWFGFVLCQTFKKFRVHTAIHLQYLM